MKAPVERHVLVKDAQAQVVVSTLPEQCLSCQSKFAGEMELTRNCGAPGKRRRGIQTSGRGSVFFCTNDPDLVASSRLFRRELEFYTLALARIEELRSEISSAEIHKTRRLLHNLISLNGHVLQELYSVVPQDQLSNSKGFKTQKEAVGNILRESLDACATLFIRVLKNAAAVKAERGVFQKLHDSSSALKFGSHEIHRVLLNVVNYFFQDFADKQVVVFIESSTVKLHLDYESVQVALYHLLDNAAKYVSPGSEIRISFFADEGFCIRFDMISLFVPEEERGRIYSDGFSGSEAKAISKNGQGLGMGIIAELLKLNGAVLEAAWGDPLPSVVASPRYAANSLFIKFGPQPIVRGHKRYPA